MKPYYERDGAAIYLGDSRDVLPSFERASADVLVTDPPYGVNFKSNRADNFERIAGDDGTLDLDAILDEAARVLKPRRHAYVFGDLQLPLPFRAHTDLVWDKAMMSTGDLTAPWGLSHEPITFAVRTPSKGKSQAKDGRLAARLRRGAVLRVPRPNATAVKRHPTEKPVSLLRQLIESSSLIGEVVLDPFVGVGSTLVAAIIEGRRGVGIELKERYAEIAADRVDAALDWVASGEEAAA